MIVNKSLKLASLIIIILSSLTACMTPQQRYAQAYKKAKINFIAQDYGTAFHKLQTPARAGIADAQYALGYMYYYGKGTVVNETLATYWFKQAAAQGQADAKNALTILEKNEKLPSI